MGRSPGSDHENGVKKGPWLPEEDEKLITYIQKHGHSSWSALPKLAGLNRCGKSCRLRWTNYLRPDIKRGKFSHEEEQTILNLHAVLGNKWSMIASHLPGRTDNEIKNFWNTHLKKKLIQMGFDPMTHQPRTDDIFSSLSQLMMSLPNLKGLVDLQQQFPIEEQALLNLQAEITKLQLLHYLIQPHPPMSINPNELNILNLLTKENSINTSNLDLGFLTSYLQEDFNNNLPSLKSLDENQNSNPSWLHQPTMLPSHNPSALCGHDLARNVDGSGCNEASSINDQEGAATTSIEWSDHHHLFDDSIFQDIIPYQS